MQNGYLNRVYMYTLYFLPGDFSLATQAILWELNQSVELIHKGEAGNFLSHLSLVEIHERDC